MAIARNLGEVDAQGWPDVIRGLGELGPAAVCAQGRPLSPSVDAEALQRHAALGELVGLLVVQRPKRVLDELEALRHTSLADMEQARLAWLTARARLQRGELEPAGQALQQTILIGERAGDEASVTRALILEVLLETLTERFEQAERAGARAQARLERLPLGALDRADLGYGLAGLYLTTGRYELALRWAGEALDWRSSALGPDHPALVNELYALAAAELFGGQWHRAEQFAQRGLALVDAHYGDGSPVGIRFRIMLATAARALGRLDRARRVVTEALEVCKGSQTCPEDKTANLQFELGVSLGALGRFDEAIEVLERCVELRAGLGSTLKSIETHFYLASYLLERGKIQASEVWLGQAEQMLRSGGFEEHPVAFELRLADARVARARNRLDEARTQLMSLLAELPPSLRAMGWDGAARLELARVHRARGDSRAALDALDHAAFDEADPATLAELALERARAWVLIDRIAALEAAREARERYRRLAPEHPDLASAEALVETLRDP